MTCYAQNAPYREKFHLVGQTMYKKSNTELFTLFSILVLQKDLLGQKFTNVGPD